MGVYLFMSNALPVQGYGFVHMPLDYRSFFESSEEPHKYWGKEAAGCLFIAKDTGRILIAHRSGQVDEPGTWSTFGGKLDIEETPKQAIERELEEETGFTGKYKISHLYTFQDKEFKYHDYVVIVPFEFNPKLNWENENAEWFDFGDWPDPMHFGLETLLWHAGSKIEHIVKTIKSKKKNQFKDKPATEVAEQKRPETDVKIRPMGLEDEGIHGYEMTSPFSYVRYALEPTTQTYYIRNIGTPKEEDKNRGHATFLLDRFFQMVKQSNGVVNVDSYTTSGRLFLKHVIEGLARKYNVRLV